MGSIDLYHSLPPQLQDLAVTIASLPRNHRRRWSSAAKSWVARFQKLYSTSNREIESEIVWTAKKFFKNSNIPQRIGIFQRFDQVERMSDLDSLLEEMPESDKSLVRSSIQQKPQRWRTGGFSRHTSGTTGAGLHFKASLNAEAAEGAIFQHYVLDRFDSSFATFNGNLVANPSDTKPPFWRRNLLTDQTLYSVFHISPANIWYYVSSLNEIQPQTIVGYPSALSQISELAMGGGLNLAYTPNKVVTSSETLSEYQERLISEFFGVDVTDFYGTTEQTGFLIRPAGQTTYWPIPFVSHYRFVPIGPDSEDRDRRSTSRLLGTCLVNECTPFVNYDSGDLFEIEDINAKPYPTVRRILGREEDYLMAADGTRIGRLDHLFKDAVGVVEAQIQQLDGHRVRILVVPSSGYETSLRSVRSEVAHRLAPHFSIEITEVSSVPKEPNGKLKFVKRFY